MGRWAQRRRGRGGGGSSELIAITSAHVATTTTLELTYSGEVTAGDFATADFITDISSLEPDTIAQDGTNGLLLTFSDDLSIETAITYTGVLTDILTPQTVNFT